MVRHLVFSRSAVCPAGLFSVLVFRVTEHRGQHTAHKAGGDPRGRGGKAAAKALADFEAFGFGNLPVCIAKTQYSFSDNAALLAAPEGFAMNVRDARLSAGAGFVVVIMGDIMTMPGLPKKPAAENIDVDENGVISGLF